MPSLFGGQLSRRLAWAGIAIGVVGELSALILVIPDALFLVPLMRFPAFVWLIWAGFRLSGTRTESAAEPSI